MAPDPTSADEAREAVERATGILTESYQTWPKVRRVVAGLERFQHDNHIQERVAEAFRQQ